MRPSAPFPIRQPTSPQRQAPVSTDSQFSRAFSSPAKRPTTTASQKAPTHSLQSPPPPPLPAQPPKVKKPIQPSTQPDLPRSETMAMSLARPVLRSPAVRTTARRVESTAAAKETASKAQQGLSRVTSAAGPAIAGAARGVGSALSKMGGRTGRLIAFAEHQTPFVVYHAKVAAEVAKLVFQGQKMAPPPVATFQNVYQNLWRSFQNRTPFRAAPQNLLQRARNVTNAQLVAGGVVAAECLGFFTVGEMIGRFKIVGYRGETGARH